MPQETDRLKLPLPLGNENVTRESINGIFEKIDAGVATQVDLDALREAVSQMDIPDASLTQKGKVQLSDAINETSKNKAATPNAVKLAYDEAVAAKQLGVETKSDVVATLNSIGVSASTGESWDSLIAKMAGVIRATGNATVSQVLAGATFSNASGNGRVGTIPNRGAGGNVTPGVSNQVKAAGYYSSAITVPGEPNMIADNILVNKSIYGVSGSLVPNKVTEYPAFSRTNYGGGQDQTIYTTILEMDGKKRNVLTIQTADANKSYIRSMANAEGDEAYSRLAIVSNAGTWLLPSSFTSAVSSSSVGTSSRRALGSIVIDLPTGTISYVLDSTTYTLSVTPRSDVAIVQLALSVSKRNSIGRAAAEFSGGVVRYEGLILNEF
ncbi:tail fiber protein [Paenibacillus sp. 2KB_22]|uniref:tail fiber protein n=1 Tax=Paenibacillus sp. 2KB_22 TaxID=3232978 RepID=UPI003F9BBC62